MKRGTKCTFLDELYKIVDLTKEHKEITLKRIFAVLAGKGYAALLILLSLPFCLPVQIPGFSTPFGLILAFLGLRIAFEKRLWWPKWILEKRFQSVQIKKLIVKSSRVIRWIQKLIKPRFNGFMRFTFFKRLNGILVFFLALLLSLPLPMSNFLCATPILCMGIGLLENDGYFLVSGYVLASVCLTSFLSLFIFGKALLSTLFM